MKTGFLAALMLALAFITPASAQKQKLDTFGPWTLMYYPATKICAVHSVFQNKNGEKALFQWIARGKRFQIQILDPRFPTTVGEEFGTIVDFGDDTYYVRMKVLEARGLPMMTSKMDVDKGLAVFANLATADRVRIRYKDTRSTYPLQQSDDAARGLLTCNELSVQK